MNEEQYRPAFRLSLSDIPFYLLCVVMLLCGIFYRFNWNNWNEGASLHPDEYGLTNTLTAFRMPDSIGEYFNTRLSPISPYDKYDLEGQKVQDGPDNRMRWGQLPIILLRWSAELTGNTGYDEMRLQGRYFSALMDSLSLLFIFFIGRRLFGVKTGLLAMALSSLAAMQIQQSHFMTSDNFAAFFAVLAIYACVRIARLPAVERLSDGVNGSSVLQINRRIWKWYGLFGLALGMAVASKVNLAVLAGMLLVATAVSIADIRLKSSCDFRRIMGLSLLLMVVSGCLSLLTFRVAQPMSFRAASGDTTLFTLHFNQDWMDSMQVASAESRGEGGGPPAEQWAHRPAIIFPLVNMVMWGLGLPLGLAAWSGFLLSVWLLLKKGFDWQRHIIPLAWVGGYFLFMGTRWVKSMRYFLPIYPFLCLFAAWALLWLWHQSTKDGVKGKMVKRWLVGICMLVVCGGTLLWANAFTRAVYAERHTRLLATEWMFSNIPGAVNVTLQTAEGVSNQPVAASDGLTISQDQPAVLHFQSRGDGVLSDVYLPRMNAAGGSRLWAAISADESGENLLAVAVAEVPISAGQELHIPFEGQGDLPELIEDEHYFLLLRCESGPPVSMSRLVLSNESWDESLPVRMAGIDPFGQLYSGHTMQVRWYDNEDKRQMFIEGLEKADYIILPSQRAIWSAPRIPRTYPMTMEYYRALFDGRLGFEPAALFNNPMHIGNLYISDVGGTFAWGEKPELPLFNFNLLAAEEAFSVYDHPPVWIFKKSDDFNIQDAIEVLYQLELGGVVVEGPRDATW